MEPNHTPTRPAATFRRPGHSYTRRQRKVVRTDVFGDLVVAGATALLYALALVTMFEAILVVLA